MGKRPQGLPLFFAKFSLFSYAEIILSCPNFIELNKR